MNGAAGQMPAYYDGKLLTVNMKELPQLPLPRPSREPSINQIFTTEDLDEEQEFFPVIDAIQGDGFNPLWLQILIVFNPGFVHVSSFPMRRSRRLPTAPIRITLVPTDEVYRCSVVGRRDRGLSRN